MLAFAAGFLLFAFANLVWAAFLIEPGDRARAGGALLGGMLSGLIAVLVWLLTRHNDHVKEYRRADRLRTAIWYDLALTAGVALDDYEYWRNREIALTTDFDRNIEHLKPTVFDANLGDIGLLRSAEIVELLLVHDNLRIAREQISGFPVDTSIKGWGIRAEARKAELQEQLWRVCMGMRTSMKCLDPKDVLAMDLKAIREAAGYTEPDWRTRYENERARRQTLSDAAGGIPAAAGPIT
jgi:hypothetical protein